MEKPFDEKQSLKVIYEMIERSKGRLKDDGFFFLLWGWAVFLAGISNYVLLTVFNSPYAFIPWPLLMFSAGIVSAIVGYNRGQNRKAKSYADNLLGYLWVGFTVSALLIGVFIAAKTITITQGFPLIIMLYGLGTFVSGGVVKFKPLIIGGIICWVIALVSAFVTHDIQLLLIAASVAVSYLVPGYILKMEYKKAGLADSAAASAG